MHSQASRPSWPTATAEGRRGCSQRVARTVVPVPVRDIEVLSPNGPWFSPFGIRSAPMPCSRPIGSGWPLAGRVRSRARKRWPSSSAATGEDRVALLRPARPAGRVGPETGGQEGRQGPARTVAAVPVRMTRFFSPNGPWFCRSGLGRRLARYSAGLVDGFEKDPLVEAASLTPLAGRFRYDMLPAHPVSRG
jgi:hypothetical protein